MPKGKTRRCSCCKKKMPSTRISLCETCQKLGMGLRMRSVAVPATEILAVAKERQSLGMNPIGEMNMNDVAALAKCFRSPYHTYGRLRGFINATGKLPPEEFERSKDEII